MQTQLPLFSENTKMINHTLGFFKKDNFVYYLHNGNPIYCHHEDEKTSYRYILGSMTFNGLCTCSELSKALGINVKNVQRYKKAIEEKGASWFFNREDNRGQCYKFTKAKLAEAQDMLSNNYSSYSIAKKLDVSESAVRYHIQKGNLKKNPII